MKDNKEKQNKIPKTFTNKLKQTGKQTKDNKN